MKIGILGSGNVGQALAKGFIDEGNEVYLATREPSGDKGKELSQSFAGAVIVDFATAAREGELIVLCTPWSAAQEAIQQAGADNLAGKVVIDTNNVINQTHGVMVYGFDARSAGEQVQEWLPQSKVVKAFNTVGANLMYKPQLSATPTMFIVGDDMEAKHQVSDIVRAFGWDPLDAGPLVCARELEAMALVWIRNGATSGRNHAFKML